MGLTLSTNKIFKDSPEESKGSCSIVLFTVEAMLFALIITIFGKGNNDEKIAASIIIVVYILLLLCIHTRSKNYIEYTEEIKTDTDITNKLSIV